MRTWKVHEVFFLQQYYLLPGTTVRSFTRFRSGLQIGEEFTYGMTGIFVAVTVVYKCSGIIAHTKTRSTRYVLIALATY